LEQLQDEASETLDGELNRLLRAGEKDIVVDLAFYSKKDREECRRTIEREGKGAYQIVLVVFKGTEGSLWKRIEGRREQNQRAREGGKGYEGLSINRETLRIFLEGFEWPDGEGEIVLPVE
jgi:hypothetical protein